MDDDRNDKISLLNLKGGAAIEMFDRQLQRVYNNIGDVNTSLKEREIVLKVKIKPSKDRSLLAIQIDCPPAKLAGQEVEETTADMRLDDRQNWYARERIPVQRKINFASVKSIKQEEGGQE